MRLYPEVAGDRFLEQYRGMPTRTKSTSVEGNLVEGILEDLLRGSQGKITEPNELLPAALSVLGGGPSECLDPEQQMIRREQIERVGQLERSAIKRLRWWWNKRYLAARRQDDIQQIVHEVSISSSRSLKSS